MTKFENMNDEREAGKKIIEALDAIDHWDALHKLDAMYIALDRENKSLNAGYEALSNNYATLYADNERNTRSIQALRGIAIDLAAQLARAGDYAHKEKNEVILRVVTRLLAINSNYQPLEKHKEVRLTADMTTPQFEEWEDVSGEYPSENDDIEPDDNDWTF